MNVNEFTTLVNKQSLRTKEVCILLDKDDEISCNCVESMLLQLCDLVEVYNYATPNLALNDIWGRREGIEVVLTNIHRTESNVRLTNVQHLEKDFKITTLLMCPDGARMIKLNGLRRGTTVWYLKNMNTKTIVNVYIRSIIKMKGKLEGNELLDIFEKSVMSTYVTLEEITCLASSSANVESLGTNLQNKRKQGVELGFDEYSLGKKQRFLWNKAMHKKFLEAIEIIGEKNIGPNKIVEVMNVDGLTREKVSSHLQQYRLQKMIEEDLDKSHEAMNVTNNNVPSSSTIGNSSFPNYALGIPQKSRISILPPNPSLGYYNVNNEASTSHAPQVTRGYDHMDYASILNFGTIRSADQQPISCSTIKASLEVVSTEIMTSNSANDLISNSVPNQGQDCVENDDIDKMDWLLEFDRVLVEETDGHDYENENVVLPQVVALPSEATGLNVNGGDNIMQNEVAPSNENVVIPSPVVALPSESTGLNVNGGDNIMQNEAAPSLSGGLEDIVDLDDWDFFW